MCVSVSKLIWNLCSSVGCSSISRRQLTEESEHPYNQIEGKIKSIAGYQPHWQYLAIVAGQTLSCDVFSSRIIQSRSPNGFWNFWFERDIPSWHRKITARGEMTYDNRAMWNRLRVRRNNSLQVGFRTQWGGGSSIRNCSTIEQSFFKVKNIRSFCFCIAT